MGAVGGGIWHLVKGTKNSPSGARMRGGLEVSSPCLYAGGSIAWNLGRPLLFFALSPVQMSQAPPGMYALLALAAQVAYYYTTLEI